MPRYRLVWLEIAEAQYRALAAEARSEVDEWLVVLLEDPTGTKGSIYERRSDQWSVPLPGRSCLVYAVVADPPTLILERVTQLDPARIRVFRTLRSWAGRRWFWPRT